MDVIVLGVFVLLTLSCASLTRLVVADSLTLGFRRWVVDRFGEDSNWTTLVHCPWCASMWIGVPHVAAWGLLTLPWQWWWLMVPAALAMRYLVGLLSRLEG
jgi:hypothetical protein